MAERRMFSKTIIDSDAFLDMPISTQALYFHLSMRADDDGFINNPKRVQRLIGLSEDDLKLLILKKFILPFDSGIVVIKHWKIHNYIRNDRYKETLHIEEKSMLAIEDNNSYKKINNIGIPNDNHTAYQMETQVRLDKDSIELDKDSIEKNNKKDKSFSFCSYTDNNDLIIALNDFLEMRKQTKSKMTDRAIKLMLNKLDELASNDNDKIKILNQSIMNGWKGLFPLNSKEVSNGTGKQSNSKVNDEVEHETEFYNLTNKPIDDDMFKYKD